MCKGAVRVGALEEGGDVCVCACVDVVGWVGEWVGGTKKPVFAHLSDAARLVVERKYAAPKRSDSTTSGVSVMTRRRW